MNGFGRPLKAAKDKKSEMMTFRVKPDIRAAIDAMTKRENINISTFIERAILRDLGLDQDAVSVWLAENRQRAALDADEAARKAFNKQG